MASKDIDTDKVLVYLIKPSPTVVNASPPCLKLETFLRMASIPYKPVYGWKRSTKGKMPWIEYKGTAVADSQFSIEFLAKEFGVDVDEHLDAEQRAVATAFRVMLEENTFWTLVYHYWLTPYFFYVRDNLFMKGIPGPLKYIIGRRSQGRIRESLHGHGIGRHTEAEIYGIAERDFRCISTFLGQKKFLFGDKPCLTDAVLFALVAAFIWQAPDSPQGVFITKQLGNLVEHAQRMKELYYADWDQIVSGHSSSLSK